MTTAVATDPATLDTARAPKRSALESAALHATLWTVLSYGAAQAVRLLNSLVLTRLLAPEAFGELTLVMTLIVGMTLLSDIGLEPSVIQSPRGDEPRFLDTAFTLQALRGFALWALACLMAFPAARFYHDRALLIVLPVLALSCVITGLFGTGLLSLSRHMGVRRLFAIEFTTQIIALTVTVAAALLWKNVWALVAGNLVSNAFKLVLTHHGRVVPGERNRFALHRDCVKDIVHFGKWIVLGTAFFFFASQADRLILPKLVTLSVLGIYGIAFQISDVPRSIINSFSQRVGFPFVAKLTHLPRPEFRLHFLRYRRMSLLLGAFLLAAMIVWGDQLILRLYPVRYHDAAWMVPVLALGLWHTLLYTTTRPALFSLGNSGYNAVGNALYAITVVTAIPVAFHLWGLPGAVIAVAAGDLPLYIVIAVGAVRMGLKPLWQDLQYTAVLLGFLSVDLALRHWL